MPEETIPEKKTERTMATWRPNPLFWWVTAAIILFFLALGAAAHHRMQRRAFAGREFMGGYSTRMMGRPQAGGMMARGHGVKMGAASGGVASISGNTVVLHLGGTTQTVNLASTTSFYKADGSIGKQSDLQVGDVVSVTGAPDSAGVIQAETVSIR